MSTRTTHNSMARRQQSISKFTQPTHAQLRELQAKKAKETTAKDEGTVPKDSQAAKQAWEREYQEQGKLLDSEDEEQLDDMIQNTEFGSKANMHIQQSSQAEGTLEDSFEDEKNKAFPPLPPPTKPLTTIGEQLGRIGSLLEHQKNRDTPQWIQLETNESDISSLSLEAKLRRLEKAFPQGIDADSTDKEDGVKGNSSTPGPPPQQDTISIHSESSNIRQDPLDKSQVEASDSPVKKKAKSSSSSAVTEQPASAHDSKTTGTTQRIKVHQYKKSIITR